MRLGRAARRRATTAVRRRARRPTASRPVPQLLGATRRRTLRAERGRRRRRAPPASATCRGGRSTALSLELRDAEARAARLQREVFGRQVVEHVHELAATALPPGATVLVVSRGDEALVELPGGRGWHFPQADGGDYAGHHPADSREAVEHLEDLRARGAEFLVIPATSQWWLELLRRASREHLDSRYARVGGAHDGYVLFSLAAKGHDKADGARRGQAWTGAPRDSRSSASASPCATTRRYLGEAIASALAQDVDGLEVLVHDDASTDGTREAVAAVADAARALHAPSVGRSAWRATATAASRRRAGATSPGSTPTTPTCPGCSPARSQCSRSTPASRSCTAAFEVVDEDGRRLPDWPAPFDEDTVEPGPPAFSHLLASNEITTSTVVARRASHLLAGAFGAAPRASSSDWALWLRLALRGDVAYTAAPVARYRQHAATISRGTSASGERLRCDVAVVRDLLLREHARLPDPRRARSRRRTPRWPPRRSHAPATCSPAATARPRCARWRWPPGSRLGLSRRSHPGS